MPNYVVVLPFEVVHVDHEHELELIVDVAGWPVFHWCEALLDQLGVTMPLPA